MHLYYRNSTTAVRFGGSALNRNSLDFLQILQNKVARLIVGCKIHEKSRKELHNELNWLTVRQRIHMRTAMIIHRTLYWKEPFTKFMHLHPIINQSIYLPHNIALQDFLIYTHNYNNIGPIYNPIIC